MDRLTSEQIRLLEELRELRDAGILTVDEFDYQVAKVLGRPRVVGESSVEVESLNSQRPDKAEVEGAGEAQLVRQDGVAGIAQDPDTSTETELLEFVIVDPKVSDEVEIPVADGEVSEPPPAEIVSISIVAESDGQRQSSGRRRVLVGTMAGLVLLVVIALVTLGGGEASDSMSSQSVELTVAQGTSVATTQMSMSSVTTSTTEASTIAPTTTFEVLQCPYTRLVDAVDGKIETPEGVVVSKLPVTYKWDRNGSSYALVVDEYVPLKNGLDMEVSNLSGLPIRIGMEIRWSWANDSFSQSYSWSPDNGNGWVNGSTGFMRATRGVRTENPADDVDFEIVRAEIRFLCQ